MSVRLLTLAQESGIAHVHVHGAVLGASAHEAAIAARARALAATHMDGDCPPPGLAPPARSTAEVGAAEAARLGMRLPPSFGSGRSASGQGGIGPGGKEKGSDGKAAAADGSKVLNHLEVSQHSGSFATGGMWRWWLALRAAALDQCSATRFRLTCTPERLLKVAWRSRSRPGATWT